MNGPGRKRGGGDFNENSYWNWNAGMRMIAYACSRRQRSQTPRIPSDGDGKNRDRDGTKYRISHQHFYQWSFIDGLADASFIVITLESIVDDLHQKVLIQSQGFPWNNSLRPDIKKFSHRSETTAEFMSLLRVLISQVPTCSSWRLPKITLCSADNQIKSNNHERKTIVQSRNSEVQAMWIKNSCENQD